MGICHVCDGLHVDWTFCRWDMVEIHVRHELTLQMRLELSNDYQVQGLLVRCWMEGTCLE
jgi:hypothetical protein